MNSYFSTSRLSIAQLAAVIAVHAMAIGLLLTGTPSAKVALPQPLQVRLITADVIKPQPLPEPAHDVAADTPKPVPPAVVNNRSKSAHPITQTLAPPQEQAPPATPATAAQPAETQEVSAPLVPPHFDASYLDNPAPPYPGMARRLGEEGRVLLRVRVLEDGSPAAVNIHQSSGFPRLDSAAQETVQHWRFVPARRGDQSVAAWVLVPVAFSLHTP